MPIITNWLSTLGAVALSLVATFYMATLVRRPDEEFDLENELRLETLSDLLLSSSVNVKTSALKILLGRAAQKDHLSYFCQECLTGDRLKAVVVLNLVAKNPENINLLLELRVDLIIIECLESETKELILKECVMLLFELMAHKDEVKETLVENKVIVSLKRILNARNRDLINWVILVLHNLSVHEPTQKKLLESGVFEMFGGALRLAFGNWTLQKVCFHALVRLLDGQQPAEARILLLSLQDFNIIGLISSSLKQEDPDLVYWALGLMHEFAVKDVFREEFRSLTVCSLNLVRLLCSSEPATAKLVVRVFKFLGIRAPKYIKMLVSMKAVSKVLECLNSDDEDCQYWSLTLMHDFVSIPDAVFEVINSSFFSSLLDLVKCSKSLVPLYVADILSQICSCSGLSVETLLTTDICSSVLELVLRADVELCQVGLTCVYNLSMISPFIILELIYHGGINAVAQALFNMSRKSICAKILCMFAESSIQAQEQIIKEALSPFVFNILMEHVYQSIQDLGLKTNDKNVLENCIDSLETMQNFLMCPSLMIGFLESSTQTTQFLDSIFDLMIIILITETQNADLTCQAIKTLSFLYKFEKARDHLKEEQFIGAVAECLKAAPQIKSFAFSGIAHCIQFEKHLNQDLLPRIWLSCLDKDLDSISAKTIMQSLIYNQVEDFEKTPNIATCNPLSLCYNTCLSFESIKSIYGVDQGKYMFEAVMLTDDLIQVGWATQDCLFDYIFGRGVGDNDSSWACDGVRKRKWHGFKVHSDGEHFGESWSVGDVIGCLINFDSKEILFSVNGKLESAFQIPEKVFYPALSLASNQCCKLQFDNFSFPLLDYMPIIPNIQSKDVKADLQKLDLYIEIHCSIQQNAKFGWKDADNQIYLDVHKKQILFGSKVLCEDVKIEVVEYSILGMGISSQKDGSEHLYFILDGVILSVIQTLDWSVVLKTPFVENLVVYSTRFCDFLMGNVDQDNIKRYLEKFL